MKKINKIIAAALAAVIGAAVFTGCGKSGDENKLIRVGVCAGPYGDMFKEAIQPSLEEKGYTVEITEFSDYVQPNNVVDSGELDANYFQHKPYLDDFNKQNGTNVVSVAAIHVEPMGLYGGKQTSLDALK